VTTIPETSTARPPDLATRQFAADALEQALYERPMFQVETLVHHSD